MVYKRHAPEDFFKGYGWLLHTLVGNYLTTWAQVTYLHGARQLLESRFYVDDPSLDYGVDTLDH